MKILSRKVTIPKPLEEVSQILQSSAYHYPEAVFLGDQFSIYCAKRDRGGYISRFHVKGTLTYSVGQTAVTLEVHAGFPFYFGVLLLLLGAAGLLGCLLLQSSRWIPWLGMMLLGLLSSGIYWGESAALLDRLEWKLLR